MEELVWEEQANHLHSKRRWKGEERGGEGDGREWEGSQLAITRLKVAHFGCVPVGVVVTLVDPLPKDHLSEGLIWEEQANHLYWEGN